MGIIELTAIILIILKLTGVLLLSWTTVMLIPASLFAIYVILLLIADD